MSLPENFQFPEIGGGLFLGSLTSLPENIKFQKIGGSLDLYGLTNLPNPPKVGRYIYLKNNAQDMKR